jgi:hypothetical protein
MSFWAKFRKTSDKKKLKERYKDYFDATEYTVFVPWLLLHFFDGNITDYYWPSTTYIERLNGATVS